ncbi:hypothetical protein F66182_1176 [Fusarium sp. NRRL 66182]|nr:hypothetical protein F66182_1176 [Fusarium sp. NRRL 66182]
MDPVTAVGLASAIVGFIPLAVKLVTTAKEIRDAKDNSLDKNRTRQDMANQMQQFAQRLKVPDQTRITPEQRGLCSLALKCQELSQRITALLDKIKPKNPHAFGSSYRAAFRAWRKEEDIKELETSLRDCQSQLALGLIDLSSQNATTYSAKILSLIETDTAKLEELQNHMNTLRSGIQVENIGTEACTQISCLLGLQEEALSLIYQNRILESIRFDQMHDREDKVRSHQRTFQWLLEDDETTTSEFDETTNSESNEAVNSESHSDYSVHVDFDKEHKQIMKDQSRNLFLSWLSSESGFFHISGKLGSGKSTLMKVVCTHPQTRIELQKWAQDRRLIISKFFFWRPGSELQKSLDGFYRSLLYDILDAYPELIRYILPDLWKTAEKSPWQIQSKFNMPTETVKAALEQIILNNSSSIQLVENLCFCFFVDGLDECEEIHGQDHVYLVQLLSDWVKGSHGRLKMCISSRDYNVFLNRFPKDQRLLLHELTWFDMRQYVRDRLAHLENAKLRDHFLTTIPPKADGIFLWVVLVVNEIRRKAEHDTSEERLLKLLDSLPPDLESLFQHILDGLDQDSRRMAYQTMAILRTACKGYNQTFSLLAFSFLEEYQKDADFSVRDDFLASDDTQTKESRMPSSYRKQLRGICGGLVQNHQPEHPMKDDPCWGTLGFTHRSIPEMLDRGNVRRDMESCLADFNPVEALSRLIFAEARCTNNSEGVSLCRQVSWMRLMEKLDTPPFCFLEYMNSWVGRHFDQDYSPFPFFFPEVALGRILDDLSSTGHYMPKREAYNTLYQAAILGHVEYIKWKIDNDPMSIGSPTKKGLAAHALLCAHLRMGIPIEELDYFFESGFFMDQEPLSDAQGYKEPIHAEVDYVKLSELSIWERYLVSSFVGWINPTIVFHADRFSLAVERFIKRGAPTGFSVTIDEPGQFPAKMTFRLETRQGIWNLRLDEELHIPSDQLLRWTVYLACLMIRALGSIFTDLGMNMLPDECSDLDG